MEELRELIEVFGDACYCNDDDKVITARNDLRAAIDQLRAERDALQARIDGGIRVHTTVHKMGEYEVRVIKEFGEMNATLLLDPDK